MPVSFTKFGPGTMTLDPGGAVTGSEMEISCQLSSGGVLHEYEDVTESKTLLCGDEIPGEVARADSLQFEHLADLTHTGLYDWLLTNDLTVVPFAYVPNTAGGAQWTGSVQLRLPEAVQADEYGAPIAGSVTWPGSGLFTFAGAGAP